MKNTKKGSIVNLFLLMIMAFILVIACVMMYYASTTAYTKLLEKSDLIQDAVGNTTNATILIQDTFGKVPNAYEALKWLTMLLIVGMIIVTLISAYAINVDPVYFIAYLLAWIIAIILSAPMANVYVKIYQNPLLSASFDGFFAQTYFFTHLPAFITIIGGIAAILMVANMIKNQGGSYYG